MWVRFSDKANETEHTRNAFVIKLAGCHNTTTDGWPRNDHMDEN
jgi:hypothetical protein